MMLHESCDKNTCGGLCCTKIKQFGVTIGNTDILTDINLHIHCGELTAIIGPNGAGKSTLIKAILGEIGHSGTIEFLGADGVRAGRPLIGYVPQYLQFDLSTPTSVLDLFSACLTRFPVWIGTRKNVRAKAEAGLKRVNAEYLLKRRLGALSGGELQRVLLALALEPVPNLLLLDEPVSGIDRNGLDMFYKNVSDILKSYDLTVILVSHDLEMVKKYADRVVLLKKNVLACGTTQQVFSSRPFQDVFGISPLHGQAEDKPEGDCDHA